jgi:hypothetical protein
MPTSLDESIMRCIGCGYVGLDDGGEECPTCGASRSYEYGPIALESGLPDDEKQVAINEALSQIRVQEVK